MSATVFPLHQLSNETRLQVIKSFDHLQLISFSLISSKTKALIESFNMKIVELRVSVSRYLTIRVYPSEPSIDSPFAGLSVSPLYGPINVDDVMKRIEAVIKPPGAFMYPNHNWGSMKLSFTGLFNHITSIFSFSQSRFNFNSREELQDTVALRSLLPTWTRVDIASASAVYALRILKLFLSSVQNLNITTGNNINKIVYDSPWTLDDLLILNAKEAWATVPKNSVVNRFLKSWIRGSNPRMKYYTIHCNNGMEEANILKGIPYQIVPEGVERRDKDGRVVKGNIDIRNKKGILATLKRDRDNIVITVWD